MPTVFLYYAFWHHVQIGFPARPGENRFWHDVLIVPAFETAVMGAFLIIFGRQTKANQVLACIVALFAWGSHFRTPELGTHAAWGFYVMSICFLNLLKRSIGAAVIATLAIHSAYNLTAFGLEAVEALFGMQ